MDKIEQLYNLYLSKNIITSKTSLEKFRAANQEQQNKLYELGKNKNLFQTTDFNKFQTAWSGSTSQEPVKKKSSFKFCWAESGHYGVYWSTRSGKKYFIGFIVRSYR